MSGLSYWYTRWRRILRFCAGIVTEPYLPVYRRAELIREASNRAEKLWDDAAEPPEGEGNGVSVNVW